MLRVGLTGGLGSGKSTVARLLAEKGAAVVSADELGRELMRPGQAVHAAIVEHFGRAVLLAPGDGTAELDRPALARLAFRNGRADELNALVHPAVIARQAELAAKFAELEPDGVFVVESALLLETPHAGPEGWRSRFDLVLLVVAPEPLRIARFVARTVPPDATPAQREAAREDAVRRLARQMPEAEARARADRVLLNAGSLGELSAAVDALWPSLRAAARGRT